MKGIVTLGLMIIVLSVHADESPEALFHRTVSRWRSNRRNWSPWHEFTQTLLTRFFHASTENRLELVGAFEEGILAIEKATVGEGDDLTRDAALSKLYYGYGKLLVQLEATECIDLALDPHTLLIGAETVSREQEPSTQLCVENAENALRNAATLDATNDEVEDLLRQVTGEGSERIHQRKPKEFVAELFDSFADSFDEKLGSLDYKVPGLVGETAGRLATGYRSALDAGCGTGLAGRFLRPLVEDVMVGVDASQKMLDKASKCTFKSGCGLPVVTSRDDEDKPLYQGLLALDLEEMTVANTLGDPGVAADEEIQGFDLVVAADVLVYFGQLDSLLHTFASLSTPGAALVFSCERATEEEAPLGWRLLSSGRFAHTKKHAVDAASKAGYRLKTYEEIVPRMEKGQEVKGHLFGFVLQDAASSLQNGEL